MTMLPSNNIQSIVGATVFGSDRAKLGRISRVFVDAADGHPTWAEIHTGLLIRHAIFVPLSDATWEHDDIRVPYDEDLVKHAPQVDGEDGLSPEQEQELDRHYTGADRPDDEQKHEPVPTQEQHEPASLEIDDDGVVWEKRVVAFTETVPVSTVHIQPSPAADNDEDTETASIAPEQDDRPDGRR